MTIHSSDPFATPEGERSSARRLRGRVAAGVTLWTAYGRQRRPAGLTVSSLLVADGDPGYVVATLDEESELYEAVVASQRFAVMPLRQSDSRLADTFAGLLPAPGGLFAGGGWRETPYGPALPDAVALAGCRLESTRPLGYGVLVTGVLAEFEFGADGDPPLVHHRGRYLRG